MKLHANAALSLRRADGVRVVEQGWSSAAAAAAGDQAAPAGKWVARYRPRARRSAGSQLGAESVANRTDERAIEAIAALRRLRLTGPEIAELLIGRSRRCRGS